MLRCLYLICLFSAFSWLHDVCCADISEALDKGSNITNADQLAMDYREAMAIQETAKQKAEQLSRDHKQPEADAVIFQANLKSNEILNSYINKLDHLSNDGIRDRLNGLYLGKADASLLLSKTDCAIADYLEKNGKSDSAGKHYRDAADRLEAILTSEPAVDYPGESTAVMMEAKYKSYANKNDFVVEVENILKKIKVNDFLLNELTDLVAATSNHDNQAAVKLADIVLRQIKSTAPTNYEEDTNYRICLMDKATALLNLNALTEARKIINELEALNMSGGFKQRLAILTNAYDNKCKNNLGLAAPSLAPAQP